MLVTSENQRLSSSAGCLYLKQLAGVVDVNAYGQFHALRRAPMLCRTTLYVLHIPHSRSIQSYRCSKLLQMFKVSDKLHLVGSLGHPFCGGILS
jgi:hypothetical protein